MRQAMRIGLLVAVCVSLAPAPQAQPYPILQAMQEEMTRALDQLRLPNEPAPYYIAYAVDESSGTRVLTKLGSVVTDASSRPSRIFRVDVRVGDYNLDSSRFISYDRDPGVMSMYGQFGVPIPLDDNYIEMKRQMWLATDGAYKRAVQLLAKKKAAAQGRAADPDPIPDLSREKPTETLGPVVAPSLKGRAWIEDLKQMSAVFLKYPDIDSSEVDLSESQGTHYFLNSEGFKVVQPIRTAGVRVVADTQAADGMVLRDFFTAYGTKLDDLPPAAELLARTEKLAAGLAAQRGAATGEDFTGPVLVEGQAASVLLGQAFVPLFVSSRAPEVDNPQAAAMARFQAPPFLTRIGSRILPESFSIKDTPSLQRFGDALVPGSYTVDDDGVPAKDVTLVQDGRLMTLLVGRTPQKGLLQSNGHGRGGGAQAGVFQMESARGLSAAELKTKYLEMLKTQGRAFGYIVRAVLDPNESRPSAVDPLDAAMASMAMISGQGGTRIGPPIVHAVKVLPDGTEQPVRGLTFASGPHTPCRTIVEASKERTMYTYRAAPGSSAGSSSLSSGVASVSVVAPDLLFEEIEIQRARDAPLKPPVVPSPLKK